MFPSPYKVPLTLSMKHDRIGETQPKRIIMLEEVKEECDCSCHHSQDEKKAVADCCQLCPHCGLNIKIAFYDDHFKRCSMQMIENKDQDKDPFIKEEMRLMFNADFTVH